MLLPYTNSKNSISRASKIYSFLWPMYSGLHYLLCCVFHNFLFSFCSVFATKCDNTIKIVPIRAAFHVNLGLTSYRAIQRYNLRPSETPKSKTQSLNREMMRKISFVLSFINEATQQEQQGRRLHYKAIRAWQHNWSQWLCVANILQSCSTELRAEK